MMALKDPDKGVRREAAKALGAIKDARAVAALLQALRDEDTNVRVFAAYALGEIKDPKTTSALLGALGDPAWCVRDQAAWALREIGDPKTVASLVTALARKKADAAHIVWLLRHAGGANAVKPLAEMLQHRDPEARLRAIRALDEIGATEAVEPLLAALKDGDPRVRLHAVNALRRIGDDRAEMPLRELMATEKDPSVREATEKTIAQLSREADLAGSWSFDDGNAKTARDGTGRGNDGEIRGCAPVKGKVGLALRFSKGKYVELGRPKSMLRPGVPLTVTAWVEAGAKDGVVVGKGGAFCGFSLYIKDGVAKFGIRRTKEEDAFIATGSDDVVGSWVHLAGVIRGNRIELYVNGKLAGTTKIPGPMRGYGGQGLEIGYDAGNSAVEITDNFEGAIDEVKIYRAALSAKDIAKQCGLAR